MKRILREGEIEAEGFTRNMVVMSLKCEDS